jgi:hypothetical protein
MIGMHVVNRDAAAIWAQRGYGSIVHPYRFFDERAAARVLAPTVAEFMRPR